MNILIQLTVPSVENGPDGTAVSRTDLKCVDEGFAALEKLLAMHDVTLGEKITFRPGEVVGYCADGPEPALQLHQDGLVSSVREALTLIDEVTTRYHAAYMNQTPIERTTAERHVLAFNKSASAVRKCGGRYAFLPGTVYEHQFDPVAPGLLECPEPTDVRSAHIELAVVTGARAANGMQQSLLAEENAVDVVISLLHKVAEVRYSTTLSDAQRIWQGLTRMTADVRLEDGKKAQIIGSPIFIRE